jgi:Rab5 GDP/GTP exchange factor
MLREVYDLLTGAGFLRNVDSDQSADSFVPLLIYTVLRANPEHLVSNVQYILRFRNQDKLGGEAGYYISSLVLLAPTHQS